MKKLINDPDSYLLQGLRGFGRAHADLVRVDLERRIKRNEFDLIVMRSDVRAARSWKRQLLLPETVRLAIKDTYVPAGRVGMFWLYKPEERRSGR